MHQPFTYLIKHKTSGKVYYGVRYAKKCSPIDLWTTYFTSSDDNLSRGYNLGRGSIKFKQRKE